MPRSAPTYYIEVDTYWQNSKSMFVGPFFRKDAAAAYVTQDLPANANIWLSTSTCGGNIRDAWRIYPQPISKTNAKRRGMQDGEQCNVISPLVKPTASNFSLIRRESMEMAY